MNYRFSMTPRLIALSCIFLVLLLVLLFLLGVQLGGQWAQEEVQTSLMRNTRSPAVPSLSVAPSLQAPSLPTPSWQAPMFPPSAPSAPMPPAAPAANTPVQPSVNPVFPK